jgi:DNA-binding transcriptional LysR family regulator
LPEDAEHSLRGHSVLMFADERAFRLENVWLDQRIDGAHVALRSDSVSALYAATLVGTGIGLLPRRVADRDKGLVRVETTTSPEPRVIWQTVHEDLQRSARIRAVMDFLAEILVPPPSR